MYNITGMTVGVVVVAGLDIPEGTKVNMPTLTVAGKAVPLTGVTLAVVNGAMVLTDPSASLMRISEGAWTLMWGSRAEETQVQAGVRVASE